MTQHDDVYNLIAKTSNVIKQAVKREGRAKYPECIDFVQTNMAGKTSCADVIRFMQQVIQKYDR
jgi:hypothetical protein